MLTWIFLIGGIILMVLETVLPSGMALILGFSGLLVGVLRFMGLLTDPTTATLAWFLTSVILTVGALPFIKKYFGGETSFKVADEDYEAMDQIVDVVEDINDLIQDFDNLRPLQKVSTTQKQKLQSYKQCVSWMFRQA